MWQAMAELGEDPARYRSLLRDVLNSYPPRNPLELRICEDIMRLCLFWRNEPHKHLKAHDVKSL
jgi:hypothetical protein